MKLPEFLFIFLNPVVKLLLRSPIHQFWSGSFMLITFTGRKSGMVYTIPVRYVTENGIVRCFTNPENLWWRNLRGGAKVRLRIAGQNCDCVAEPIENDSARTRAALLHYFNLFPQDTVYHHIRLNKDKTLNADDFEKAVLRAIVVEAKKI